MFGKLKDKLKNSLSIFSKKAEEEATEEVVEEKQELEIEEKKEEPNKEIEKVEDQKEIPPEPSKDELLDLEANEEIDKEELEEDEEKKEEIILNEIEKIVDEPISKDKIKVEDKEEIAPEPSKDELLDLDADEKIDIQELIDADKKEEELIEKVAEQVIKEDKEEKKGFFSKIKQKLTTKTINQEKFEELFWDLELVLLENNVSVKVIEKLKENLKDELVDKPLPRDVSAKILEVLRATLKEILSVAKKDIFAEISAAKEKGEPYTIIFFGINGSGKTTTIAKLAHMLKEKGITSVLAAGDTFRAAAIHQLEDHANRLEIKMIKHDYGSDAAAVAYDAKQYAIKNNIDVVLIDTAGRLHSNANLMAELEKIMRVAKPDCKIFIGESITGNDCVEQAEKYATTLGVDGMILSKADIDEMGGAPLSICYVTGKPILFLGMGQEYKDLVPFTPELILEKLGME